MRWNARRDSVPDSNPLRGLGGSRRRRRGSVESSDHRYQKTEAPLRGLRLLANDSNFDRNRVRGCNFGSEGGAVLDLRGCSSLQKGEECLHEIMC